MSKSDGTSEKLAGHGKRKRSAGDERAGASTKGTKRTKDDQMQRPVRPKVSQEVNQDDSEDVSGSDGVPLFDDTTTRDLDQDGEATTAPMSRRQQKRSKKRKRNFEDVETFNDELSIDESYAHMSASLLADQIGQKTSQFGRDLSSVELDDLRVPELALHDTSDFAQPRTLANLPAYLRKYDPDDPSHTPKAKGSPHTIVIASSGILCADLTRSLRVFESSKDTPILKLFAKHQKMSETVDKLSRNRTPIVVGTPQRLLALLEQGNLKIKELRRIVVCASHIDEKKRGIMSMKDVFKPLVQLLTLRKLKDRYGKALDEERTELLFF